MKKLHMAIVTMTPGLTELGKIKIGMKGETRTAESGRAYQLPQKLDHFIVTKLDRDTTGNFMKDINIHRLIGDKPKRIPITLLFDDVHLNFQSRFACYQGTNLWCTGDGEYANRTGKQKAVKCPCDRSNVDYEPTKDRCKMNGVLSCIIRGGGSVGGVWKFRTTSFNTIQGITSSLFLIRKITGGWLAGLDLDLVIVPKTASSPDGKTQTIYVVGVEYIGDMTELRDAGLKLVKATAAHSEQMKLLETSAVNMISEALEEDTPSAVSEWYPQNDPNYVEPEKATIDLDEKTEVNTDTGEVTDKESKTDDSASPDIECANETTNGIEKRKHVCIETQAADGMAWPKTQAADAKQDGQDDKTKNVPDLF